MPPTNLSHTRFQPLHEKDIDWSRPPDVDLVQLQQNSACLVRQYHAKLANFIDRLVLLSLPAPIRRVSAGANHQPETLHWLNIVSGWIATELLHQGKPLDDLPPGDIYGYALDDENKDFPLKTLGFQSDGKPLLLERALNATRVLAAFGTALQNQIGHGRLDPALPKATYRFLRELQSTAVGHDQVRPFLQTLSGLCATDQAIVNWFREASASLVRRGDPSSRRDQEDIQKAFAFSPDRFTTDVRSCGKLLNERKILEQDFVTFLLDEVNPHTEPASPEATALSLYGKLREVLLNKLLTR